MIFMKAMKNKIFRAALLFVFVFQIEAENQPEGDWFSADTLSSVVKLSSIVQVFKVEGLPDNYKFHMKGENPDFGDAVVLDETVSLEHVGTGVVVNKTGLILSNAHVTRAYSFPEIFSIPGPENRVQTGPNGKPVKYVRVNPFPDYMFVGVTDKDRIESGDDSQRLKYLACVLADDPDYENYVRDRAVLQILATVNPDKNGNPVVGQKVSNLNLPFANLGNPFKMSFVDRKVRAIGFPGTGDPNRSARTSGELLGYQNDSYSDVLHTSYISGGNSGGGLFHKDCLIGINTWDKLENRSRPLAVAQPITYWYDMLFKVAWLYPKVDVPNVDLSWLEDDPSNDAYKREVQAFFSLVSESNKNEPVTKGTLYVHRVDTEISDVFTYLDLAAELNAAWNVVQYLQYYSVDEVVEKMGFSREFVGNFQGISKKQQIRDMVKPLRRPFFDEWYNGTFYCKSIRISDSEGKTAVSVPKNSKVHVTYVTEDGKRSTTFTLTTGDNYVQGPFTVSVVP